jgi:hypothetical protein
MHVEGDRLRVVLVLWLVTQSRYDLMCALVAHYLRCACHVRTP